MQATVSPVFISFTNSLQSIWSGQIGCRYRWLRTANWEVERRGNPNELNPCVNDMQSSLNPHTQVNTLYIYNENLFTARYLSKSVHRYLATPEGVKVLKPLSDTYLVEQDMFLYFSQKLVYVSGNIRREGGPSIASCRWDKNVKRQQKQQKKPHLNLTAQHWRLFVHTYINLTRQ